MNEPTKPHRKVTMRFNIGADSYEEMLRSVEQWVYFMQREHPTLDQNHNGASGGPDAGYSYDIEIDPDMTHDRYFEELDVYLGKTE